jgi:hypothetical protein
MEGGWAGPPATHNKYGQKCISIDFQINHNTSTTIYNKDLFFTLVQPRFWLLELLPLKLLTVFYWSSPLTITDIQCLQWTREVALGQRLDGWTTLYLQLCQWTWKAILGPQPDGFTFADPIHIVLRLGIRHRPVGKEFSFLHLQIWISWREVRIWRALSCSSMKRSISSFAINTKRIRDAEMRAIMGTSRIPALPSVRSSCTL